MELKNWLLRFGCASEELRVVVAICLRQCPRNPPPGAAYRALMACRLVVLNKRPRVRPVGIGETFRRALAKLVMTEDSVCQPTTMRRPQDRHRGSHTCCGTAAAGEVERETL